MWQKFCQKFLVSIIQDKLLYLCGQKRSPLDFVKRNAFYLIFILDKFNKLSVIDFWNDDFLKPAKHLA